LQNLVKSEQPKRAEAGGDSRSSGRYSIAVLGKALDLLDALDTDESYTLTQLSARVGVPKATTLRVLANLEDRGYVERDLHGEYRLGMRLLQLGARKSAALDIRTIARPVMKQLHAEFDETVNLAVPGDDGLIYIDIMQSPRGLRMAATVGMGDHYHSSALGKAIMSSWSDSRIERELGRDALTRKTERTLVTREEFQQSLADVRRRGYAVDDEENEAGARCVGAPIFDHRGTCIGAVSVSGSVNRITPDQVETVGDRVKAAAVAISKSLGYVKPGAG
jgi:DNA-binding IclR family transcriptional regulator